MTFSTYPHNAFNLNRYTDKQSLVNGITNVRYQAGGTSTDDALKYVRENSFTQAHGGRYGVPKILVVMTDGQSSDPTATATEARIIHYSNIKVIAIGIGSGVQTKELNAIATDSQHAFTVPSFNSLQSIETEIQTATCVSEKIDIATCDSKQADIVFVLDASGSEGHDNFQKQLDFVSNVTDRFDIGPNNIQVSLVTFGTHSYNEFFLNSYANKTDVIRAIQKASYTGGTTNTAEALKFVRENSFKPENGGRGNSVTKLVVVLTDGNSNSQYTTKREAANLHHTGVKVISVGIGSSVSRTELAAIASDSRQVFTVANFNSLTSIQRELESAACTTPSECGDKPTDIVFVLDSSGSEGADNFHKQLDFMTDFVKQFDIGPSDVQVSLITFSSTAHNEFYLNTHQDKPSLIAAIQSVRYRGGTTATYDGLRYARYYHLASYHGARPNATKLVIVMTDGRSDDVSKTVNEAVQLKNSGAKVISIGIGASVNQYELNSIATDRNHAFTVGSFDILHTLQEEIKDESCGEGTPRPTPNPECGNQPADIVFVLDSSASEGSINFQKQLDFVRDFAYQFAIGPQDVQISVIVFSSGAHEQFPLNKYHDQASLLAAISRITYNSGATYTDRALSYVRTNSFTASKGARPNATDLVIVITDGQSTHPTDTAKEANLLKNQPGVKVVAIGIGSGVDHTELETIASDSAHAIAVANFNALDTIKSELTFVACQTCGFISKADIVFVLDASSSEGTLNFQKQLDFVSRVANDFQIGPNHVQIGMITFSDFPNLEFYLNQYPNKAALLSAIQKTGYLMGVTRTDEALKYARENMFSPIHGARDDAKNYLIVLTDGVSANTNLTIQQANMLKSQKIEILAVGIGTSINKDEINGIASDSSHVFTVSSFDALKTVRTDIKKAACEEVTTTTPAPPSTKLTTTEHFIPDTTTLG